MRKDNNVEDIVYPLVSIIVTCYNHENYIGECIRSLLAQTYPNIEIFITDDCSKDSSDQVIREVIESREDDFIKITHIRNEHNIGAVRSLNKMIRLCKGSYIKLLDGDDMLLPNAIADLTSFLEKEKEYGLVYSNHILCDEKEKFDIGELKKKDTVKSPAVVQNMSQALLENDFIITPTVLIRKKVYDTIGLHDEKLTIADWEFWLRVSFSFPIGYLDRTTGVYRVVPNSMSRFTMDPDGKKRLKTMIENEFCVLDKFKDYPSVNGKVDIRKCCDQGISIAIDMNAVDVVAYIQQYLRKNQVLLSFKMELKYLFFKMHIWKLIKRII